MYCIAKDMICCTTLPEITKPIAVIDSQFSITLIQAQAQIAHPIHVSNFED